MHVREDFYYLSVILDAAYFVQNYNFMILQVFFGLRVIRWILQDIVQIFVEAYGLVAHKIIKQKP